MNVTAFTSAREIAAALLADRSVIVPAHASENSGQWIRERRYDLSDVGERITEDQRRLIEATSLTDFCEAGRLMRAALHHEAARLAVELFNDNCVTEPA